MKNRVIYISIIVLVFLNLRCQKPQEQLQPETQEGKFTIGFKVNGKVYQASGKDRMGLVSFGHVGYTTELIDSSIRIRAVKSVGQDAFTIWFRIKYTGGPGTYLLKSAPYKGEIYFGGPAPKPEDIYESSNAHPGIVNIKYFNGQLGSSPPQTVLAGTFEMNAINQFGKLIKITEGRFDIGN